MNKPNFIKNEDFDRRFFFAKLRVDDPGSSPVITGYAALYNEESEDLGGFVEVIEPGFFEDVLEDDTRALFNHDRNFILGRRPNNTLRLMDDIRGLGFQADPPETQLIQDLVIVPMRRGDIDQCSFAFYTKENGDRWEFNEDRGIWLRTLLRGGCAELLDVSVVTYAAYPQTSSQVRSKLKELYEARQESASAGMGAGSVGPEEESNVARVRSAARKRKLDLLILKK